MATASSRPRLRPIETVVVPDRRLGKALVLRDTQGIASSHAVLPVELLPIVSRMDGRRTCEEIANQATSELREHVPVDLVVALATELETALFVEGAPYRRERDRIAREFAESSVRPASHAGGAYHDDPHSLAEYIDRECLAKAKKKSKNGRGSLRALIAPHIDPWRGARCYGHAYTSLRAALSADVDTFVLFGTSHAPMRAPFALCRKAFATPLGAVEADTDAIDRIASAVKKDFDPYEDQLNHKREHSLEFQAVFLRHLLGKRKARIIPILAGLGEQQHTGKSPARDASIERFFAEVRAVVEEKNAVVIAGADLAHVGPRFGDRRAYDERQRAMLDETDRESLEHAERGEAEAFWSHVAKDLDTRRVCGLGPIYSLLRTMRGSAKGRLAHYEQTVDTEEGSIVSHAAMGFYG